MQISQLKCHTDCSILWPPFRFAKYRFVSFRFAKYPKPFDYMFLDIGSSCYGPIYTGDGSSIWDKLGQRTVVRLIIRLCINTSKQMDHPSSWVIHVGLSHNLDYPDSSCEWMILLLALPHLSFLISHITVYILYKFSTLHFIGSWRCKDIRCFFWCWLL